jgi:predicted PhzF superfamily epimerase YddE/YHI9
VPPFHLVDAFTRRSFSGNPAGVVVLEGALPEAWMADVAAEVNASETAFVHPDGERWALRWFTPTVEVDLCGHATLATAHVLWTTGVATGTLRFATRSGELVATRDDRDGAGDAAAGPIWMSLPAWPVGDHPTPTMLAGALPGIEHAYVGRTTSAQPNDVAEVPDEATLRMVRPDLSAVAALGSAGLIVTAPGDDGTHFVSRYFAPTLGVDEDPVTGSAHATLGPLWAGRLGRTELSARQVSPRGGELALRVEGDRVQVGGHARTIVEGHVVGPG